jgi:hypothetical protein
MIRVIRLPLFGPGGLGSDLMIFEPCWIIGQDSVSFHKWRNRTLSSSAFPFSACMEGSCPQGFVLRIALDDVRDALFGRTVSLAASTTV